MSEDKRKRRGLWWKIPLASIGGLLLLTLVTLAVALSDWGLERICRVALPAVNKDLRGKIDVGRIRRHGAKVWLNDIVITDPEGHSAANIQQLMVHVGIWPLMKGRIVVHEAELQQPRLDLRARNAGLNLARALESAREKPKPAPKKTDSSPTNLDLHIGSFRLRDGAIRYSDERVSPATVTALDQINVDLQSTVRWPDGHVDVRLDTSAHGKSPVQGPLTLAVRVEPKAQTTPGKAGHKRHAVSVNASAMDSVLRLAGTAYLDPAAPSADVKIAPLRLSPRLVKAFAPTVPLRAPLRLEGRINGSPVGADVNAILATEGGRIDIQADAKLGTKPHIVAKVRSTPIDLQQILEGAAATRLQPALDVDVKGSSVANAEGTFVLELPPGMVAGRATGPIAVHARADAGNVFLDTATIEIPGLKLNAEGHARDVGGNQPLLQARADVTITDLAQAAATAAAAGGPPPAVAGKGDVHIQAQGRLDELAVDVASRFASLRFGTARLTGVTANARLPALRAPWAAVANVAVARVEAGGRTFTNASLNVTSPETRVTHIRAQVGGAVRARLESFVRFLDDTGKNLQLDRFSLTYPGTTWATAAPTQLAFGDELRIQGLRLRSEQQRIDVDVSMRQQRVRGDVVVVGLDVDKLAPLLGPAVPAKGSISLDAHVDGRLPLPDGRATLSIKDAAVGTYGPLTADVAAKLSSRRASGVVAARGLGAALDAKFNVPASWPWPAHVPADVSLQADVPDLKSVAETLKLDERAAPKGALRVTMELRGRGARPTVAFDLSGKDLELAATRIGNVELHVADTATTPLAATLKVADSKVVKGVDVTMRTPIFLHQILRGPRGGVMAALAKQASEVDVRVADLNVQRTLQASSALSPAAAPAEEPDLEGLVNVNAQVRGTLAAPTGNINVRLDRLRRPGLPPTNATLAVQGTLRQIAAQVLVSQASQAGTQPLLNLDAKVDVPAQPKKADAWMTAPLTVTAAAGPVKLQHVEWPGDPLGTFTGTARADLRVTGTVAKPDVDLQATLKDAKSTEGGLGNARLAVLYQKDVPNMTLEINAAAGGRLTLEAGTGKPLPWQQTQRPDFAPKKVPLRLRMKADNLALSAFNGLARTVRDLEGHLRGELSFAGTLDDPRFAGRIGINDGGVDIVEVGRFRDIVMDVVATESALSMKELKFRSGSGRGRITMQAERRGEKGMSLAMTADLNRFPLQAPQRKLGELSLQASAKGGMDAEAIRISPLEISDANVFLEGKSPKQLQDLSRPDDVVFVRNGKPVDKGEARKLAALGPPEPDVLPPPEGTNTRAATNPPAALPVIIKVKASRNLWVHGPDANVEFGLSDDFQIVREGDVQIFGTVLLRRGSVNVFGRRFDVQDEAQITFTGPPDAPRLDVTMEHLNERERVRVWVTAKGSPEDLKLSFRSDPVKGESEIITMLITGRLPGSTATDKGSKDRTAQAASILGGLLASKLQRSALRRLPIDVLSISSTAIEAGTYVTDDFYVGYVRRLAASPWRYENVNAVHLEYEITPSWSFEGEYGDAGSGSGDLIWKRRY